MRAEVDGRAFVVPELDPSLGGNEGAVGDTKIEVDVGVLLPFKCRIADLRNTISGENE